MIKHLHKLTDLNLTKLTLSSAFIFFIGNNVNAQYKIDPRFEHLINERKDAKQSKISSELNSDEFLPITSIISPDGTIKEYYQAIIYTKNPDLLKKDGYLIQSISDNFVTALLSENDFDKLKTNNYVSTVKFPQIDYLNNQSNVIESGASLLQDGALNNINYTGKDVLVGIYDTGIDFTHPDFIDPITKKTRIVSIWDQTLTPITGESSPKLYAAGNFGVEYTQAQINDEIDGTPANFVREKDIHGHGTHVAGTAAGNGSAIEGAPHKGMAPEAELVIVKGGDGSFPTTNTIAALDYFKSVAASKGKPIVVNMSIGGQASPHDGKSEHEIKVNEFTASGLGRVVVISAGNEGDGNIHQRISLNANEKKSFKIKIEKNQSNNNASLFSFLSFNKGDNETSPITLKITAPNGSEFIQNPGSVSTNYLKDAAGKNYQQITSYNYIDSDSGKRFIQIIASRITTADTEGVYDLEIENNSTKNITIDGWLTSTNYNLAKISFPEGDNNYTVGSPGTADEAITVANYVGNVAFAVNSSIPAANGTYSSSGIMTENLNSSSSKGPRADEARKPDIASGGTFVISAKTKDNIDPYIIDGKYYSQMTGTSMASPSVAGSVALLLQANNRLTAKQVKQRLIENTNKDSYTTSNYTNEFGYGKLNIYKAVSSELNNLNNNTSCPVSINYTLANDNLAYKWGFASQTNPVNNGTNLVNFSPSNVAVKLKSSATGKIGNVTFLLGNYNSNTAAKIPLIVEIRKVNDKGFPGDLITSKTIENVKTLEQSGWNNINFIDKNININAGEEVFVLLNMKDTNLILGADNINIDNKTYRSVDNGKTYSIITTYDAKIRATIYENEPSVKQLATVTKTATQNIGLGYNYFINGCEMITRVESYGASPVKGKTTAKIWIDDSLKEFVNKRVEVNAETNNSTSTGKVTLYYTQSDFDIFNKTATLKLPTSPTDVDNKKNVIVHFYAGTSSDNTGLPTSYTNKVVNIPVNADDIIWNDTYKYWEVSVETIGFGGYLLSTNSTLAINETSLSTLSLYPNPVVNELNIKLPTTVKEAQIRIVDISGRTVKENKITTSNNKLDVTSLSQGVYIIEIKTDKETISKKIIKK